MSLFLLLRLELKFHVKTLHPRYTNVTLLKLFYFVNFFVSQIFKNVALFALAAGIKMPCKQPPDPPKPNFFGRRG